MQIRLDELFFGDQASSKKDEIEGVSCNKNNEIGLHFTRIRPRLWEQIRLDEFFYRTKFRRKRLRLKAFRETKTVKSVPSVRPVRPVRPSRPSVFFPSGVGVQQR